MMRSFLLSLSLLAISAHAGTAPSTSTTKTIEDAWQSLVSPLTAVTKGCGFSCQSNSDCDSPCGVCDGVACQAQAQQAVTKPLSCEKTCRSICCKNGGKDECVTACGCPAGSCPKKTNPQFERSMASYKQNSKAVNGGCKDPGACGLIFEGCCFGAKHSGDACTCTLVDGSGEVGSSCDGTDKAGACGVAYTACCIGYKAKGDPCTCDVESP